MTHMHVTCLSLQYSKTWHLPLGRYRSGCQIKLCQKFAAYAYDEASPDSGDASNLPVIKPLPLCTLLWYKKGEANTELNSRQRNGRSRAQDRGGMIVHKYIVHQGP